MPDLGATRHAGDEGATTATIRIVVADDHPVVRRGLRLILDAEPDLEVVADAGNVDDARRYVRGHHPNVLVLDLNMPGGSSL
ncbi:MAG: two-component system, NarL family, response regulator NreC, partial [Solirubrobacteraceae bacterium]|nr:two-component system, NarL family, response regulator NreC [Solirubrobacteraceae bacterium]